MARVTNQPRAQHAPLKAPGKQQPGSYNHLQTVPLNDDRQEKAARLQSRQALHDLQMNSLKAATSPMRRYKEFNRAESESPGTPKRQMGRGKENLSDGALAVIAPSSMTPVKRIPILANFEEWMKMATDNKINAANSWNFALIDYFHDMSLLKEGDGVNFQKASCTLDGCVKIYTSRVDSVATETGKLLSGLADSGGKRNSTNEEDGEEGHEDGVEEDDGEDGAKKKARRRAQRSSEATLVPSFASLALRKMELEFAVDPLFKKVAADFDEGGAKGLLLNHLAMDSSGRIVFDSSDDLQDASGEGESNTSTIAATGSSSPGKYQHGNGEGETKEMAQVDIAGLGARFFPDLTKLDRQDLCPSLKDFDLSDPVGSVDLPNLKAPDEWRHDKTSAQSGDLSDQTGVFLEGDNIAGFDDDDDGMIGDFGVGEDPAFGEGGDLWVKGAAIKLETRSEGIDDGEVVIGDGQTNHHGFGPTDGFDPAKTQHVVSLRLKESQGEHQDILSYFDNALQKSWAGPEHWRIRRIKDLSKAATPASSKRKEKEPFEIDFAAPLDPAVAESIYTPAVSNSAISLPRAQWTSKTRNLLPDDKHFNSRQLLQLFLKPKARSGSRRLGLGSQRSLHRGEISDGEIDKTFWARKGNNIIQPISEAEAPQGDYDANFFQDDDLGPSGETPEDDLEFADAREALSPGTENPGVGTVSIDGLLAATNSQEGTFGSQLVTQSRRLRPEYVQYARVAKKVDVRRLKEEMWRGTGYNDNIGPASASTTAKETAFAEERAPLKFTSIMKDLQNVYPQQTMADISTSYCFICLLHLANEKGLSISNEPGLEELTIQRDLSAEIVEHDA